MSPTDFQASWEPSCIGRAIAGDPVLAVSVSQAVRIHSGRVEFDGDNGQRFVLWRWRQHTAPLVVGAYVSKIVVASRGL